MRGRPQKYPWSLWLNGSEHTLVLDRDLECSLTTFRANLWKHSKKANVRTITRCETVKSGRKTLTQLTIKAFPVKVKNEKTKTKRKLIRSS